MDREKQNIDKCTLHPTETTGEVEAGSRGSCLRHCIQELPTSSLSVDALPVILCQHRHFSTIGQTAVTSVGNSPASSCSHALFFLLPVREPGRWSALWQRVLENTLGHTCLVQTKPQFQSQLLRELQQHMSRQQYNVPPQAPRWLAWGRGECPRSLWVLSVGYVNGSTFTPLPTLAPRCFQGLGQRCGSVDQVSGAYSGSSKC